MTDVKVHHTVWLLKEIPDGISQNIPRIAACVRSFKYMHSSEDASILPHATIPLPIRVEIDCEHEPLNLTP